METLVPNATCQHRSLRIPTVTATEFVDLTDYLERLVADAGSSLWLRQRPESAYDDRRSWSTRSEPLLHADFASLLEKTRAAGHRLSATTIRRSGP